MTDDPADDRDDAPGTYEPPGEWRPDAERIDDLEIEVHRLRAGMGLLAGEMDRLKAEGPRAVAASMMPPDPFAAIRAVVLGDHEAAMRRIREAIHFPPSAP